MRRWLVRPRRKRPGSGRSQGRVKSSFNESVDNHQPTKNMKRPNQFASLLLVSISALTLSALAQSSGSGSGATPGAGSNSSIDRPPSSSSGTAGSQPGSVTEPPMPSSSGSVTGSASTDSSRSSATTGVNNGRQVGVQGSLSFDKLDADNDGRISLTEYTKLSSQSSSAGLSGGATGSMEPSTSGATSASRSSTSTGISSGAQSGQYTAAQFHKLDRDHDGYLSRGELTAAQNASDSEQIKQ